MKYRLIDPNFRSLLEKGKKPYEIVLHNRGVNKPSQYLSLDDTVIFSDAELDNINEAVKMLAKHMENGSNIAIIVDADVDGFCSAGIMYKYLMEVYRPENLTYLIHSGKQHGISRDISVPDGINLLIVPDAGTNDIEECMMLQKRGLDVIVLDHHEPEGFNPYAVIVNPTTCDYPNKQLSGCAVTYKFLQALDAELWEDKAGQFIDLVALSLISDSMDLRVYENKRLVDTGLCRVSNKFFAAVLKKQEYYVKSVNINNVQFYVVPLINAIVRSGSFEEKDLMFRAFIESDETFPYAKRGEGMIEENIYDRVARLAVNAKARQDREVTKGQKTLEDRIEKFRWDDNKILFVNGEGLDSSFTGLVSMRLASKYFKPCIVIRETKTGVYAGSARNYDDSPIQDLKAFLSGTGMFNYCQGHPSAFGLEIDVSHVREMIAKTNELLKDVEFGRVWKVDFALEADEIDINFIREMDKLKDIYGNGIKEGLIVVQNIEVNSSDIQIKGKDHNAWSFVLNDDVVVIKFRCDENDPMMTALNDEWGEKSFKLNIVAKAGINEFNGISTPQLIIEDYEIC